MNLIEQLGGYDKAKHWDKNRKIGSITADIYHNILALELLEYRRENNTFEVGDYYTYLYEWDSDLDIVCEYNPSEWGDHLWNIKNMIRHATDEEIEVGHRI